MKCPQHTGLTVLAEKTQFAIVGVLIRSYDDYRPAASDGGFFVAQDPK